jgi:hypothetical protein
MKQPIKLKDICVGDLIRVEWGDCAAAEYVVTSDHSGSIDDDAQRYFLIRERPVVLPTVPGFYVDRDGDVWKLSPSYFACLGGIELDDLDPELYAPFTRLVPEV